MSINSISSSMLSQTLNLLQIASETAKVQGVETQFDKLKPVENQLREIVVKDRSEGFEQEAGGILKQQDFATMLDAIQGENENPFAESSISERNTIIGAMAAGGMNDLDIARHLGVSRDEVNIVLNLQSRSGVSQGAQI